MKAGRKPQVLTEKEMVIMKLLWNHGPMSVRQMLELYPEPKPHFNTVSTLVRILEEKGHVSHTSQGGAYCYHPIAREEDFRNRSLSELVSNFFNNSYKNAVSALVEDEKISVDDLKDIIRLIESNSENRQ